MYSFLQTGKICIFGEIPVCIISVPLKSDSFILSKTLHQVKLKETDLQNLKET